MTSEFKAYCNAIFFALTFDHEYSREAAEKLVMANRGRILALFQTTVPTGLVARLLVRDI